MLDNNIQQWKGILESTMKAICVLGELPSDTFGWNWWCIVQCFEWICRCLSGCRDPGLLRVDLTVDKCLNWIRMKVFECGEFLVIFGWNWWCIVQCFEWICRCFEWCRDPGLLRVDLTVDKCLNWIRMKVFECGEFLVIFGWNWWCIVQCFEWICRCLSDVGIQAYWGWIWQWISVWIGLEWRCLSVESFWWYLVEIGDV